MRTLFPILFVGGALGCSGFTQPPALTRLVICTDRELAPGEAVDADTRAFALEGVQRVPDAERRFPTRPPGSTDDDVATECGTRAERVDLEVATAEGVHAWLALTLLKDGAKTAPAVALPEAGLLDVVASQTSGFPDVASVAVGDASGPWLLAEVNHSVGRHVLGDVEIALGEAGGVTWSNACGDVAYRALRFSADDAVEIDTGASDALVVQGAALTFSNFETATFVGRPGGTCPPDAAFGDMTTWMATRG